MTTVCQALRVAAYCRVSTDKSDQINSLETQKAFFLSYIQQHAQWIFAGIFSDEGLSGTGTKKRPQFTAMIEMAMNGKIDLILTKEVSRFARNTVDALSITRMLKVHGVGVLFLNDNIDTRENDGEFRLTIMASVAQEESRKISERTLWGQEQAMRRGVAFGNNSVFGYHLKEGTLSVYPEQAEIVRKIYDKFLNEGKGSYVIARELTEAGIAPPLRTDGPWSSTMVLRILKNEKYTGDLLQHKYRTLDHLSHQKVCNDGAIPQFLLHDHHPAIVSREAYAAVQQELAARSSALKKGRRYSGGHWYSGKIICGECGCAFTLKRTRRRNGREYCRFVCRGRAGEYRLHTGKAGCGMRALNAQVISACMNYLLDYLALDGERIILSLLTALRGSPTNIQAETDRLLRLVDRQKGRQDRALAAYLDGVIDQAKFTAIVNQCQAEIQELSRQLAQARPKNISCADQIANLLQHLAALEEGEIWGSMIQQIVVFPDNILVKLADFPVHFLIKSETVRKGRELQINITDCRPIREAEKPAAAEG